MRIRGLCSSAVLMFTLVLAASAFAQDPCAGITCDEPMGNTACVASVGICVPVDGQPTCVYPPANEGKKCSDRDACTLDDVCHNGECVGTPKVCGSGDACSIGTCDPDSGECSVEIAEDNTPCDDANACTSADVCTNGVCGGVLFSCAAADQCHEAGTCNGDGTCNYVNKSDGTSCDDGNACTESDACVSGECKGSPKTCTPPDSCHEAAGCNPDGSCLFVPKADGVSCDDGNACSFGDVCTGGVCQGAAVTCAPPDQCHEAGTCNPDGSCSYAPKANGSSCNDGNACTTNDVCNSGVCGGSQVTCAAPDQCHEAGTCGSDGACHYAEKANGSSCSDGNACTRNDTCQSGSCVSGAAVVCDPLDTCHDAGECNPQTGACSNPEKVNGTACDEGGSGGFCSSAPTCQNGSCSPGACTTCGCEVQGAGQTTPASGGIATFSFNVKNTTNGPTGKFQWNNHDRKQEIKGTITKMTACSGTQTATIEGVCGPGCTFIARVREGQGGGRITFTSNGATGTAGEQKLLNGWIKLDCASNGARPKK